MTTKKETPMQVERILSFKQSQEITEADLKAVAGAGSSTYYVTYDDDYVPTVHID